VDILAKKSISSLQSMFSSSNSVLNDMNSPQENETDQTRSFPCRTVPRSPVDILSKKSESNIVGQNFAARFKNSPNEQDIETEIELKLSYLEVIRKLKEGKRTKLFGIEELLMNIKDGEERKEKGLRTVEQGKEEIAMMNIQTEMVQKRLDNLKITMNLNKEEQVRKENILLSKLSGLQSELSRKKVRNNFDLNMPANVDSCVQFSNLFCLAGQLEQLCKGEQGSKWVIERILLGGHAERTLVRQELNLPQDLVKYLTSHHCIEVIIVLSEVDSLVRKDLIHQASLEINTILGMEGGQEFVTRLVKC